MRSTRRLGILLVVCAPMETIKAGETELQSAKHAGHG